MLNNLQSPLKVNFIGICKGLSQCPFLHFGNNFPCSCSIVRRSQLVASLCYVQHVQINNNCLYSLLQRRGSHLSIKNLDIKDIKVRILSEYMYAKLHT